MGYLAETAPAYGEMTVSSFLNFICDARRITGPSRTAAIERVVDSCAIGSVFHQTIETLSKGYRRRVGLGATLIHDPPVLLLDEPTDGLDPNQKHDVRQLIGAMAQDKCIVVSTHILEEVEAICTRCIIVAQGRILVDDTPENLKQTHHATLDEVFRKLTSAKNAACSVWRPEPKSIDISDFKETAQ